MENKVKWGNILLALSVIAVCSAISGGIGFVWRSSIVTQENDRLIKNINKSANAEIQSLNEQLEIAKLSQAFDKEKADQKLHYSSDYYSFDLPQGWSGYAVNKKLVDIGRAGTGQAVEFGFAKQPFLFNIVTVTKEQWEKMSTDNFGDFEYLGENSKTVFLYSKAKRALSDETTPRFLEVNDIINTIVFRPVL